MLPPFDSDPAVSASRESEIVGVSPAASFGKVRAWLRSDTAMEVLAVVAVLAGAVFRAEMRVGVSDIEFDDETLYLESGRNLLHAGLPRPDWGPIYAIWYWVLSRVASDPVSTYDLNIRLLTILTALALYGLARAWGATRPSALLVTACTLPLRLFSTWPFPNYVATLLLVCAVIISLLRKSDWTVPPLLAAGLVGAVYVRPEFALAACAVIVGLLAWLLVRRLRGQGKGRGFWLGAAGVLAAGPLGLLLFGNPFSSARSTYAFAQHYALNVIRARGLDIEPWTNFVPIVQRDFGEIHGVFDAVRANPAAIGWHVLTNLRSLPGGIASLFELERLPDPARQFIAWSLGPLFLLAIVACGMRFRARRRAGESTHAPIRIVAWAAVGTGFLASLVIYPREHYLLTSVVFGLALLASSLSWLPEVGSRRRSRAAMLGALAASVMIAVPGIALGAGDAPSLEGRRTIELLRQQSIQRPVTVLESDYSRFLYAGVRFTSVPRVEKQEGLNAFLQKRAIDIVVLNDRLRQDTRFRDDPEFTRFNDAGDELDGFRFFRVARTNVRVAIRRELLAR